MSDVEHVVNFGSDKSIQFVKLSMAEVENHGARIGEPIVRCRDCVYICNREYANGLEYHTCSYFDSEYAEVEPDGFCSWGERRDG